MTEAKRLFEQLLRDMGRTLVARGFRRKGKTFDCAGDESCAIIEFQRSADSGPEAIVFTVNVGLAYPALPSVVGWDPARGVPPKTWDCHISVRIGHFLPDRSPGEYWWLIDEVTDLQELERTFHACLEGPVMELISQLRTLYGLRRYWLRKADRGSIEDRELAWLQLLDDSIDIDALARKPERLARNKRQPVGAVDFSNLAPLVIETPKA